jgi:hypothetical protein
MSPVVEEIVTVSGRSPVAVDVFSGEASPVIDMSPSTVVIALLPVLAVPP